MTIIVPQSNCWLRQVVFIAQRTQACCAQQEKSASAWLETEPARGEHTQEVSAGKKQDVTIDRVYAFDRAVRPRTDLAR
jgi:hypothetical protein